MTTSVVIAVSGNKEVLIETPSGDLALKPGGWITLNIHGEQKLSIKEYGEFVSPVSMTRYLPNETKNA